MMGSKNTAVKLAGIALVLGGLAGCGGSDGDSAADAPEGVSQDGFCEKFNGLYDELLSGDPEDTSGAIEGVKDWAGEMEDYGTPDEMSDEAREGFEVVISTIKDLDADASVDDFQNLGDDLSDADNEAADTFGDWTTENCPEPELPTEVPSAG